MALIAFLIIDYLRHNSPKIWCVRDVDWITAWLTVLYIIVFKMHKYIKISLQSLLGFFLQHSP